MSYPNLTERLADAEQEFLGRQIKEATTEDAIAFIPAHIGMVRNKLKKLSKYKDQWNVEVLENTDSRDIYIENKIKINVPNEHWESFQTMFTDSLNSNAYLNLRELLIEAVSDDMRGMRKQLKPALTQMYNEQTFASLDKIIAIWLSAFKSTDIRSEAVVGHNTKTRDIQRVYGQLLRSYGDDKGNLEMLLDDIDSNNPLNTYAVFKTYDYLYGSTIISKYEGIKLYFDAYIDNIGDESMSIRIDNSEVLDNVEEEYPSIKRVGEVIYPSGGSFEANFIRGLKVLVDDMAYEEHYGK